VNVSGAIVYKGQDLRKLPERALRKLRGREIAMIFQDPMTSLNPMLPIGRQIAQVVRFHLGLARSAAEARAVALLDSVGIPAARARAQAYPHELSGGMRQRAMIALALSCDPKLVIADEPTTALDVTVQAQILAMLKRQQEERRMALVLITHNLGVVAGMSDDVAVMYAGRIVEKGATAAILRTPRMPYTVALLRSVPRLADPSHTRLHVIAGRPPDLIEPSAGCRFAPRCALADDRCLTAEPQFSGDGPTADVACWHPLTDGIAAARKVDA
jgi:peptide/nickel transport system ATP-binding protein